MQKIFSNWSSRAKVFSLSMFISTLLLGVAMFILFSGFQCPGPEETGTKHVLIPWNPERKLTIDDYTIVSHPLKDGAAATSCTGITMEWQKDLNRYLATAVFDKTESKWDLYKVKRPQWTLNHEQRHFDIVQYVVTKLNLSLLDDSNKSQAIKHYNESVYLMNTLQDKYDKETNYSQDSAMQAKWNKFIDSLPKKVILRPKY